METKELVILDKVKLLLIAETMEAGVRRHVMELIKGLDKNRFSIKLIYGNRVDNVFIKEIESMNKDADLIKLTSLDREINPKLDIRSLVFIRNIIKTFKPDIVHCHSTKAGVIGRLAAKTLNVDKVFYTPHAYSFQSEEFSKTKKLVFIRIEKFLSKRATTYTFNVSDGEKNEALINKIDKEDKFKVIYNGIPSIKLPDKYSIRRELGLPEDSFIIGNNARLCDAKNPLIFLSIAKSVVGKNPRIHFVYCGDGPLYDECIEYIRQNNLERNVHLLGFRDDAEIIVNAYDMFLITSSHEGLPYSLIESMRASVPIMGFSVTGIREIISKDNGILILNEQEASQMIINYSDTMSFSKELIYAYFLERFSIDKMLHDIQTMYVS